MADSARHALRYVAESTYGSTPTASPSFSYFRNTGCNLNLTKEGFVSNELFADRSLRDFRHGVKIGGGGVPIELSYGSFDDMLEAALGGTWAADVLKAGTTRRSFSILRHFTDITTPADKPYHMHKGQEVNSLDLTIPANGIVTGTFSFVGQDVEPLQDLSSLTTPVLGDPSTVEPFDSFSGAITEGGSALAVATEITLSLQNGLGAKNVIGTDLTNQPSISRSVLTGNIQAYFENSSLLEKFLDETQSSLVFSVVDPAGNTLQFNIPKLKYTGGQPDVSGEGPIEIPLPFQAMWDSVQDSNLVITRTAA